MLHMHDYEPYVRAVERLANRVLEGAAEEVNGRDVAMALDGQPSTNLRHLVSYDTRKAAGTFFTSSELRRIAIAQLPTFRDDCARIFDSSMGAGDLLLACSERLPIWPSLTETLEHWGYCLRGVDLHGEFVRLTKSRLVLAAVSRGAVAEYPPLSLSQLFPLIHTGDGLRADHLYADATHLTLNPSFAAMKTPNDCDWATGSVSAAAVFIDHAIMHSREGTRITAILPDVLRTGSRYERWRCRLEKRVVNASVEVVGQFDAWTDVHVFIFRATVGAAGSDVRWWQMDELEAEQTVNDHFVVGVGAVVPHRDPEKGEEHSYLTARTLASHTVYNADEGPTLRYPGTTLTTPFVVLRRTRRPGQGRVVGTLVTGQRSIAAENHLVILKPRNGSIESCHSLLEILNDQRSDQWLDQRIRCRHLTVQAVRDMPWWQAD